MILVTDLFTIDLQSWAVRNIGMYTYILGVLCFGLGVVAGRMSKKRV